VDVPDSAKPGGRWVAILVLTLVVVHLAIAASTVFQAHPLIWPLHNDTIHRLGRGAVG
jgi:hypothetical protein